MEDFKDNDLQRFLTMTIDLWSMKREKQDEEEDLIIVSHWYAWTHSQDALSTVDEIFW